MTSEYGENSKFKVNTIIGFCWAFALFHQGIVITVTFKMLHTFLLKRTIKLSLYNNQILTNQQSNYMNSKHWNIKFTVEHKENNSLAFLDIKIFRDSRKFQTSVYRKPTFSGALTNFGSFLPISYKYNLVSTLLHCGFMICSSYRTLHFEILKLKQIFQSNEYPQNFVDSCIKMYLDKVFINTWIFVLCQKRN